MADSTHLASPQPSDGTLEHEIWGWEHRIDLLRNLAAHALTSGQPLVAADLYQQIAVFVEKCRSLRKRLETPPTS